MTQVIKRDGTTTKFDSRKIENAILKAMRYGSGVCDSDVAASIAAEITLDYCTFPEEKQPTVYEIEEKVYKKLIKYGHELTARAYEEYRAVQSFKRQSNTTDESILSLVRNMNEEVANENSNKNATMASTQRDLIAGEVSKDISRRKLIPAHIVQAHDNGAIHFHDMDYSISPIFNCCLVNIADMLDNGTVINAKLVESPKSFQVACTVVTQIIAQISSGQYGGQSLNVKHLGKYLAKSRARYEEMLADLDEEIRERKVKEFLQRELESGVQTIQYQINTLMTTNGQSPFVTLFLEIEPGHEYEEEIAMIVNEILVQRHLGIKNEKGVYITPAFPKLVYVLDENNVPKDSKYRYVTDSAIKCSAKRLYPDYISAKEMRKIYEGNVFSPMGCRSFLAPWKDENGEYKFEGRFNMGVVTLNLVQVALTAEGDMDKFWNILDERLALCKEALLTRYELLKSATSDISPIHWQFGGLARLGKHEPIAPLLENGYATISLGYIGMYEMTKLMMNESHTSGRGKEFCVEVIKKLKAATDSWKKETGLGFGLYGTPAESLCYRFCKIDLARFGEIEDITAKGYYTNSYHVDVRENIDAFSKLLFEADFQKISTGGCISYVEIPNMNKNLEALDQLVTFIYENIQYAEFNTKSDYCHVCSYDGEIIINDDIEWECPQCGNKDKSKMNVTRRTCGYLGENYFNLGKTKEIKSRVLHL
ncbi:MAG TPA: anaerobic ribonucleoside-triphosphate reductase [Lachnospiraceae bacterium]|nr:anaerobic ribonucleoside-triphosphate reductase [uncultured Lachnoclostridium sp.]HAU85114.1 anaerobic ribonucleoside-triphosphate reductase [Lachnospiraceae bacterium]